MTKKSKKTKVVDEQPKEPKERADFAQSEEMEKHFLELCLREVTHEGYTGVSLTHDSWERFENEFKERWNVDYTHKQFRNRYDYLRDDYMLWIRLIGISGHGVGPITGSIEWPPQKWKEVIAQIPKASRFQKNPLKHYELMQGIFEGTLAHGKRAKSNASAVSGHDNVLHDDGNVQENYVSDDGIENFSGVRVEYDDARNLDDIEVLDTQPPTKSVSTSKKSKKRQRNSNEVLDQQIENVVDILKNQFENEAASKGPSLTEAMVSLRDLFTLGAISAVQFNRAKFAFCEKPLLATGFMEGKNEAEKFEFLSCIPGIID